MIRRPPRSTRTDTLFPYTTLFRSPPPATKALDEILANHAAQDFPKLVIRQRILERDLLRYARGSQFAFDQILQLGCIHGGTRLQHHRRGDTFTPLLVRHRDHRRIDRKSVVSGKCVSTCSSRWSPYH